MADETPQGRESAFVETSKKIKNKNETKNQDRPHPALSRKRERGKA
jgi:hypothetical protein